MRARVGSCAREKIRGPLARKHDGDRGRERPRKENPRSRIGRIKENPATRVFRRGAQGVGRTQRRQPAGPP
jgi:hypothetical protein